MKRPTLFILFFTLYFSAINQNLRIEGIILDSISRQKIPYSTIHIYEKLGKVSDEKGGFSFTLKEWSASDGLLIRSLGYKSKKIPLQNIVDSVIPIEILLSPRVYKLGEVSIFPPEVTIQRIGPSRNKKICRSTFPFSLWTIPSQFAILLNPKKEAILDKVEFFIAKRGKHKTKFRVQIYEADTLSELPGRLLLHENVFGQAKRGNQWVSVNLRKYNIKVNARGFFVAIEILDVGEKGMNRIKTQYHMNGIKKTVIDTLYGANVQLCSSEEIIETRYSLYSQNFLQDRWFKTNTLVPQKMPPTYYPLIGAYVIYEED